MAQNEEGKHTDGSVKIWKNKHGESLALLLLTSDSTEMHTLLSFRTWLAANGLLKSCFSVLEKRCFDLDHVPKYVRGVIILMLNGEYSMVKIRFWKALLSMAFCFQ
jgi:hypothetical protein